VVRAWRGGQRMLAAWARDEEEMKTLRSSSKQQWRRANKTDSRKQLTRKKNIMVEQNVAACMEGSRLDEVSGRHGANGVASWLSLAPLPSARCIAPGSPRAALRVAATRICTLHFRACHLFLSRTASYRARGLRSRASPQRQQNVRAIRRDAPA